MLYYELYLQFHPHDLHTPGRQHRDKQMSVRSILRRVELKHRTQAQLTFQAEELAIETGWHRAGAPLMSLVLVQAIKPQKIRNLTGIGSRGQVRFNGTRIQVTGNC